MKTGETETQEEIKDCPICHDEIYPDHDGDYFCMDCSMAFITSSHPKLPLNRWVKFNLNY